MTGLNMSVQQAVEEDVPGIYALLAEQSDEGNLLPRSIADIDNHIDAFVVIRDKHDVVGCAALQVFTADLGEVRSLVVHESLGGQGCGSKLVNTIQQRAQDNSLNRLMALTYVPDFFRTLGFKTVPKESLPEKVWGVCIKCYKFQNCDEIAVLKYL